ncbi:hypothetical protein [Spiroplasma endosymbiont of Polydrusus pterygomalis]|uniref:hypothetical protein n=1 Tax=Spiroplasma endosymbiont of Polydrusus pterygomalis TaxID=3139327 RepID=UPI003CCB19B5
MISKENNEGNNNNNEIELLNKQLQQVEKKLQATADELKEVSILYAKCVKESLEKGKKIKDFKEQKNEMFLINCQELLKQLDNIKDSIKINYEMIKKLNQKNNNDKSEQEFEETIQQEIKQLLPILVKNENTINEYQKKIEEFKNNSDKKNKGIDFYQNLINDKNNEIVKIKERINLLKNTKNCNDNENNNNCCSEIKEKLKQLITNENDKMIKIDEIYQWQKIIKIEKIANKINNIDKIIDELKKEKNNILPKEIKEKISKIEDINNKILDNNHQICLLEKEIKQDPNNEKLKEDIKNLTKENDKLTDEKNNIINKDNEKEKIISQLKEIEKQIEQERKAKQELEQQLENLKKEKNDSITIYQKMLEQERKAKQELEQQLTECQEKSKKIDQLENNLKKCQDKMADSEKCNKEKQELENKLEKYQKEKQELEKNSKINENDIPCNDNEIVNVIITIPEIKNGIYCITGDNNDNIYCVGKSNKVFKITKNKKIETIGEIDDNSYAIKYDGLENIFIGSTKGTIYKYDIKNKTFTNIKQFTGDFINKIETDNNHNIYIGTWKTGTIRDLPGNGNVYKMEVGNTNFSEIKGTDGVIWSFAVDKDNNIYVGTTRGLFKTNNENIFTKCEVNIPYENSNIHAIRAILIDKEENIWIGTREGEHLGHIYKCKKGENKFVKIHEASNGEVFTLAIDSKQNIYAGTWNKPGEGYFLQYYPKINSFGILTNIPKNLGSVENIFINNKDDIYIGTKIGPDNSNDGRIYKIKKICM